MFGLLQQFGALVADSLSPELGMRFGETSSRDWLPPVLGPDEWSYGVLATMADSSTAWYFDRR